MAVSSRQALHNRPQALKKSQIGQKRSWYGDSGRRATGMFNSPSRIHPGARAAVFVLALVAAARPASAQGAGDGFLFRPPAGAVAIRGGFDLARAGSDVFTFVTDELTVNKRDFSSAAFAFDVAFTVSPRVQGVFTVGTTQTTIPSEFRNWLDNNDRPIQQTTTFHRVPLTGSLKTYLADPGRAVGHFAWIPTRYAPYVGAGGGIMWYRFHQDGDFIDFNTFKVFRDLFDSDGWTPTVHAFGGVDVSLSPRFAVTTEGRYQWARAALSRDFSGFDRIDLSGFALTSGITIRY
jgi:hypothetical protein